MLTSKISMHSRNSSLALVLLVSAATVCPAQAFEPARFLNPTTKNARGGDPRRVQEVSSQTSKEVEDLPNLPRYTGSAKFRYGTCHANAKGGPLYSMIYASKDDATAVMAWYEDALRGARWTLEKDACRNGYIAATDGSGNIVRVAVSAADSKGGKCTFMIQYKLKKTAA